MTEQQAWRCTLLARYGFSYKAIGKQVFGSWDGSTAYSVKKALRDAGIKVRDYRDMKTDEASKVVKAVDKQRRVRWAS